MINVSILQEFEFSWDGIAATQDTPGGHNLGLVVLLLSNQNPVILLGVLHTMMKQYVFLLPLLVKISHKEIKLSRITV